MGSATTVLLSAFGGCLIQVWAGWLKGLFLILAPAKRGNPRKRSLKCVEIGHILAVPRFPLPREGVLLDRGVPPVYSAS